MNEYNDKQKESIALQAELFARFRKRLEKEARAKRKRAEARAKRVKKP